MKEIINSKLNFAYAKIRSKSFEYIENQRFSNIIISGNIKK
ncbi:MAG: hypothetical protein QT05_C0050G0028 [archaeon GW2011_AR13]|nr:MAG: hypothetical protein QT05_C0050G0028 [archaeon GW2011_AR13]